MQLQCNIDTKCPMRKTQICSVSVLFTVCLVTVVSNLLGLPPGEYDHGHEHSVSCNTGYSLAGGASSITCTDGSWVPADITCYEGIVEV